MSADQAARRRGYAAESELRLRNALEAFCRDRWGDARVVHELVMGQGKVRADVAAIAPTHMIAFEVKGQFDDTTRLLHQIGMYQLCVPEVWMVLSAKHDQDGKLLRHLIPSVGLLVGDDPKGHQDHFPAGTLNVVAEACPRSVVPEMALEMLWRDELASACQRTCCFGVSKRSTRPKMIEAMLGALSYDEIMREVYAELRGRDAIWRADAPVPPGNTAATEAAVGGADGEP
ncbi:MAG: hypothetical protein GC182_09140 [Rhodopseudomonas sp.]|nr:hypothetical protein [Rhodopseudomonas sp.]